MDVDGGNLSACLVEVLTFVLGHFNEVAWPAELALYHPHAKVEACTGNLHVGVLSDDYHIPDADVKQIEAKMELQRVWFEAYGRGKSPVQSHWVHLLVTIRLWSLSDTGVSGLHHIDFKVFKVQQCSLEKCGLTTFFTVEVLAGFLADFEINAYRRIGEIDHLAANVQAYYVAVLWLTHHKLDPLSLIDVVL